MGLMGLMGWVVPLIEMSVSLQPVGALAGIGIERNGERVGIRHLVQYELAGAFELCYRN